MIKMLSAIVYHIGEVKLHYINLFVYVQDYLVGALIGLIIAFVSIIAYLSFFKTKKTQNNYQELLSKRILENYSGFAYSCLIDEDWTMKYLSTNAYKILGYANDDLIDNKVISYNDLIHPDFKNYLYEKWKTVIENNQDFNEEYKIVTKSNEVRWVREKGFVVYDNFFNPIYLEGFIEDITEEKIAILEKNMIDNRYTSFIDNLDFPVLIYHNHHIIKANYQAVSFFKAKGKADLEGIHVEKLLDQNYFDYYRKRVEQIEKTKSPNLPTNYKFKLFDDTLKSASLQTIPYFVDNELYLHVILFELSDNILSNQQLRKIQRRNRDLILYMNDGIGVFQTIPEKKEGKLIFSNKKFNDFVSKHQRNLIYMSFDELFPFFSKSEKTKIFSVLNKTVYEKEIHDRNTNHYYIYRFYSNEELELIVQINDVTDLKLATSKYNQEKQNVNYIIEETGIITWEWNYKTGDIVLSDNWFDLLDFTDFTNNHVKFADVFSLIHPEDKDKTEEELEKYLQGEDSFFNIEMRISNSKDDFIWCLLRGSVIESDELKRPIMLRGTFQDITVNKNKDEEIRFLSLHDHLTSLPNRRSYEKQINDIDYEKNYPLAIILADVNGLKVINDAFGHEKGDDLLKTVGRVLNAEASDNCIVARLGGDEFVFVSPKTNEAQAKQLVNKLLSIFKHKEINGLEVSVSLGMAVKNSKNIPIKQIHNLAESNMYQNKLNLKNSRLHMVNIIQDKLFKKHPLEKEIVALVNDYALKMLKYLDVLPDEMHVVDVVSKYYNIGVISIDNKVFSSERSFDNQQEMEYRKHVEAGYQIMLSAYNYDEVALGILYHHEKFDGSGYPAGLKGKEIPLASRLVAILATFSRLKIINNSRKKAINYIKSEKDSTFDPELVDLFVDKVV